MAVSAPRPPIVRIDDGVLEEARRRQRRRRDRIADVTTVTAVASILAVSLALLIVAGSSRGSLTGGEAARFGPPRLTFVHGVPYLGGQPFPLSVRPYLGAGFGGLDIQTWNVGFGGEEYRQRGTPLFGGNGGQRGSSVRAPGRQIDWFLTRPGVAAVRVTGVGTFKPIALSGLPPGVRAVVFNQPNDREAAVTPLDGAGRPIPTSTPIPTYPDPTTYFQGGTSVPADGSCAVRSSYPASRIQWGLVSTRIDAVPQAVGPAFFSCLNAWYTIPGAAIEAALLLNAQHPGATPAPLWGVAPLRAHPGLVEMRPVQYTRDGRSYALAPRLIARRVANAWVVVGQGDLAQEIAFLGTLRITKIPGTRTS